MNIESKWSDREVSRLKKMRREGKSFSEIGAAMGRTRQSVEGKLRKLSVPGEQRRFIGRKEPPLIEKPCDVRQRCMRHLQDIWLRHGFNARWQNVGRSA